MIPPKKEHSKYTITLYKSIAFKDSS